MAYELTETHVVQHQHVFKRLFSGLRCLNKRYLMRLVELRQLFNFKSLLATFISCCYCWARSEVIFQWSFTHVSCGTNLRAAQGPG